MVDNTLIEKQNKTLYPIRRPLPRSVICVQELLVQRFGIRKKYFVLLGSTRP